MANGVWHSELKCVLELDKPDLGLSGSTVSVSDVIEELLQPVASRRRDLLVCPEKALERACKAEVSGVKSPHMYVRRHRGPDGVLRLRAAHLPTVHQMTAEESDRHKAMKEFLGRTCQRAGLKTAVEKPTKSRCARPDVTIYGRGGISLGCEAQFYNASPSRVVRRAKAQAEAGLVSNWITHDDTFHLVDRAQWMLIRDVTWREIDNAADLPLVGGFRVLADWLCTAAAVRPCPRGKAKTGCGKRHLFWETPRVADGIASGYTGDRGDRLGITIGATIIGAATGSVLPIFLPSRKDPRSGSFMWVPAGDHATWTDYQDSTTSHTPEPAPPDDDVHFSGSDAETTCRFGDHNGPLSAPLPRRGIDNVELGITIDTHALPGIPNQPTPLRHVPPTATSSLPRQHLLDWGAADRFLPQPQPCRHCGKPASLLDDDAQPSHKVCAEQAAR
ncbi:hypothetical protein ACIBUY_04860 [Streptomyces sp. NPDC050085]|uniref:competence protein CoiA family protein n=1 Tax=Streptomyces sp. NPDC050085 TaxID=3365600 RepID=UPI0037914973